MLFWIAPGTTIGYAGYMLGKAWLYGLPLVWLLLVDRGTLGWSRPRHGGLLIGAALGLAIAAAVWITFLFIAQPHVDAEMVRGLLEKNRLAEPLRYIGAAAYIATVNAVLEEYVFRWFIFRKCETLMRPWAATLVAALIFTAHHVIVLRAYFDWPITLLASTGVFAGGVIWTWCYLKFRSIWPGYVSHAIVDIAIFAVGWKIAFV